MRTLRSRPLLFLNSFLFIHGGFTEQQIYLQKWHDDLKTAQNNTAWAGGEGLPVWLCWLELNGFSSVKQGVLPTCELSVDTKASNYLNLAQAQGSINGTMHDGTKHCYYLSNCKFKACLVPAAAGKDLKDGENATVHCGHRVCCLITVSLVSQCCCQLQPPQSDQHPSTQPGSHEFFLGQEMTNQTQIQHQCCVRDATVCLRVTQEAVCGKPPTVPPFWVW